MKPPVVILHGWGLTGERLAPLTDVLTSHGYDVYAPDFPGFGKADKPKFPLTLTDYADFLSRYLESHKLDKPVLIGHSFGGRVSLLFCSLYPERVRALILTGTPGFTPTSRKKIALFTSIAKLGKLICSVPPLTFLQNPLQEWYYRIAGVKEFLRAKGPMRQTFKNIVSFELVTSMRSVLVPCLLVWGEKDTIVPVAVAARMKEVIRTSSMVVIANTDHGVPYKEPDTFYHAIAAFLEKL